MSVFGTKMTKSSNMANFNMLMTKEHFWGLNVFISEQKIWNLVKMYKIYTYE